MESYPKSHQHKATTTFFFILTAFLLFAGVSSIQAEEGETMVEVTDSIPPEDDHHMPFGTVSIGLERHESIRITNTADPSSDDTLVIEQIFIQIENGEGENGEGAESTEGQEEETGGNEDGDIAASGAHRSRPPSDWNRPHDPDTLLVRFREGSFPHQRTAAHASANTDIAHRMRYTPVDVVQLPPNIPPEAAAKIYQANPNVKYVEPNYILSIDSTPDDPLFSDLWALKNTGQNFGTAGADISAVPAWNITTGGNHVVIAVIDTGIDYTHEDLADNMWVNPDPDDTFNDIHGATWTDGNGSMTSGDPMDDNDHGTHVAGTIGAIGNNNTGITGVNWNVRLMGLKFLNSQGSGTTADAVSAIEYAIDHGAHITNNSWGNYNFSQTLKDTIKAAGEANQLFVAAAGNNNSDNDQFPFYPASYDLDNIISVASSTRHDARSSFSNFGRETVHLAAPGSSILSTVPGNDYRTFSGTSMAAPHVSGVAGLLLALNAGASDQDVKEAIMQGVDPLPEWESLVISEGRLNAESALLNSTGKFFIDSVSELPRSLSPGRSLVTDIIFRPLEIGTHEATLVIHTNDPEVPVIEISLTGTGVEDDLVVEPGDAFTPSGLEGGPFDPQQSTYTVSNEGNQTIGWSAETGVPWLSLSPESGVLEPGTSGFVNVELTADAETLDPGVHESAIVFTNIGNGLELLRPVFLTIDDLPATMDVTDSVAPEDDEWIPFGTVSPEDSREEQIFIENTHGEHTLRIDSIRILGGFREDFDRGFVSGWKETPSLSWIIEDEKYGPMVKDPPEPARFHESTYTEEFWYNLSLETEIHREGDELYTTFIALRASPDFSMFPLNGDAFLIGISGDGYFHVAHVLDGSFFFLQPWTFSPHLNTDEESNLILVNLEGSNMQIFANETVLWSGITGSIPRPGRIAIGGFVDPDYPTIHRFDYVDIREPLSESAVTGSHQAWYNAHAFPGELHKAPPERADVPEPDKEWFEAKGLTLSTKPESATINRDPTFTLPDLPKPPYEIPSGQTKTIPVRFSPTGESAFERTVLIEGNDPDNPSVDILLTGSSLSDALVVHPFPDISAEGHEGGPFQPESIPVILINHDDESALEWEIAGAPDWLDAGQSGGTIDAGEFETVLFSFNTNAESLSFGSYSGDVEFRNTDTEYTRILTIDLQVLLSIGEAVGAPELSWETGGNARWMTQQDFRFEGTHAAQSGGIGHDSSTWIETEVEGPGTLTFYWKVSSEQNFDFLMFYRNDELLDNISGETDWLKKTYELHGGSHVLRWEYVKDFIISEGHDAGWIDAVSWEPASPTRISDTPEMFSLGVVEKDSTKERQLTITNSGNSTLAIDDIAVPENFTATPSSVEIPPSDSVGITIGFSPVETGPVTETILVDSDATSGTTEITVEGFVVDPGEALRLVNDQTVEGLSGVEEEEIHFVIEVPEGQKTLDVKIFGGSGDADLYVRNEVMASTDEWEYAPRESGNNESVRVGAPGAGDWYFMVHGYEDFSSVTLHVKHMAMNFDNWADSINLPLFLRDPERQHGPMRVTTLEGYAFGIDPRILPPDKLPYIEADAGNPDFVSVTYRVNTLAPELTIELLSSTDMLTWDNATPVTEDIINVEEGIETREALFDASLNSRRFFRINIHYEEPAP